jgi:hypothetical protein
LRNCWRWTAQRLPPPSNRSNAAAWCASNPRSAITGAGSEALAAALPIWRETHAAIEAELEAQRKGFDPDTLRAALNLISGL